MRWQEEIQKHSPNFQNKISDTQQANELLVENSLKKGPNSQCGPSLKYFERNPIVLYKHTLERFQALRPLESLVTRHSPHKKVNL